MKVAALLLAGAAAGCAASVEGLEKGSVDSTYASARAPAEIAGCVADRLSGNNRVEEEGGRYTVTRFDGYGVPTGQWEIEPAPEGGSAIRFRRNAVNSGKGKAETCF